MYLYNKKWFLRRHESVELWKLLWHLRHNPGFPICIWCTILIFFFFMLPTPKNWGQTFNDIFPVALDLSSFARHFWSKPEKQKWSNSLMCRLNAVISISSHGHPLPWPVHSAVHAHTLTHIVLQSKLLATVLNDGFD